jgi:hypothetical protein
VIVTGMTYHSGHRYVGDTDLNREAGLVLAEFERTGRIAWASDLADISQEYGVDNVYGDLVQVIAMTLVAQPRLCAAVMDILLKGLGPDRVISARTATIAGECRSRQAMLGLGRFFLNSRPNGPPSPGT